MLRGMGSLDMSGYLCASVYGEASVWVLAPEHVSLLVGVLE